jgi:hypothetical protein
VTEKLFLLFIGEADNGHCDALFVVEEKEWYVL